MSKKLTIEEMHQLARHRDGKYLSENCINKSTKHLWECSKGHQWEAAPSSIKRGTWCPDCAGKRKRTIEEMHQIAEDRGGRCLSDTYKECHTKLLWECSQGHQWETPSINVRLHGRWCSTCAKVSRRSTSWSTEDMQNIAADRGGKCLSKTYKGVRTKLHWECSKGHQWEAVPSSIIRGSWCPSCAGNVLYTIEEMQSIAEGHGGKCLSDRYKNNVTKLTWECSEGHQWEAVPSGIKKGTWCPKCCISKLSKHPKQEQAV